MGGFSFFGSLPRLRTFSPSSSTDKKSINFEFTNIEDDSAKHLFAVLVSHGMWNEELKKPRTYVISPSRLCAVVDDFFRHRCEGETRRKRRKFAVKKIYFRSKRFFVSICCFAWLWVLMNKLWLITFESAEKLEGSLRTLMMQLKITQWQTSVRYFLLCYLEIWTLVRTEMFVVGKYLVKISISCSSDKTLIVQLSLQFTFN